MDHDVVSVEIDEEIVDPVNRSKAPIHKKGY